MKIILAFVVILSFAFANKPVQLFNTSLTVTVRDELGNTVEGAAVKIFLKEEDYTKEKNAVEEGTTDKKGIVKFKKLNPVAYFILCRKEDKDNSGGGERVGTLKKGEFNKVTVVIQ
ncbi:MAG: carboxypeptidase regulatory-like domain-containing protein [Bacteroidetes bacterium]|nr:carboxypeptidase regulatory-like domain-containing protein [Bacteroidota bacterium]